MKPRFIKSVYLNKVDSTNDYARQFYRSLADKKKVLIYSFNQVKGRGQRGNTWISSPQKNLTFTLIVPGKDLKDSNPFSILMMASLSIIGVLSQYLNKDDISIKWPNDIYVHNRKIGGILIENSFLGKTLNYTAIGIGLNINQNEFDKKLPDPTGLSLMTGDNYDLFDIQRNFVRHLIEKVENWKPEERLAYEDKLFQRGILKRYKDRLGNLFKGVILGIDERGLLKLDVDGQIRKFDFKEIVYIK